MRPAETSSSASAMVWMASSQLMASNLPSPRSPTRFSGACRRSCGVDVRHFGDAAQADGVDGDFSARSLGSTRLYALVADGALQIAPNEAVKLVGQMGHALARLGVRLGRCEPSARRCHAAPAPARPTAPTAAVVALRKLATRHCALGRFRFRHLSPFLETSECPYKFPPTARRLPQGQLAEHSPILLRKNWPFRLTPIYKIVL